MLSALYVREACRQLLVFPGNRDDPTADVALYLQSAIQGFFPRKLQVFCGLTVVNASNASRSVYKGMACCCLSCSSVC